LSELEAEAGYRGRNQLKSPPLHMTFSTDALPSEKPLETRMPFHHLPIGRANQVLEGG